MDDSSKKFKKHFKVIRRLGLLLLLALACWYSYAWWRFGKLSEYQDWSEGMAISQQNGKYGYVNEKFKLVIGHAFDIAYPFENGRAITGISYGKDYRYRLIDKQGKYLGEFYDEIKPLGDGIYKVRNHQGKQNQPIQEKDYQWQLMNQQGQIINPKMFTLIDPLVEGIARVCILEQCGFIDTSGQMVVALGKVSGKDRYQQVTNFSSYGATNRLEHGQHFSQGLARSYQNNKVGFMNKQGQIVIPHQFLDADNFRENLAVVLTESGYGVINTQGHFVIKPNKAFVKLNSFYQQRAIFSQNHYQGVIDNQGKIIVDIDRRYTHIANFKDGVANIIKNGLHGFIDTTGKEIIPPIYEELGGDFVNGRVWAIDMDKQEMIYLDKNHKIVGKNKVNIH